jgi:preprotein translocase subunit YajC
VRWRRIKVKPGDRVILRCGVFAEVVEVTDGHVDVAVDQQGGTLRVEPDAIRRVVV